MADMKSATAWRRPYRMVARAESAAATGERILDAAVDVFWELPGEQLSLDEVARRAGGAVRVLVDHYEAMGDRVLRLLADEERLPSLRAIADRGRVLHRDWCARVFAPALEGRVGVQRRRRLAQLVAICDIYSWKLLRRDAGLSRRQTELALVELLEPLLEGG